MNREGFASYHPLPVFLFLISAIVLTMFLSHPWYLLMDLAGASVFYFFVKGRKGLAFYGRLWIICMVIAVLNGVFNAGGSTVLFTWWQGRPFTLEALLFGVNAGFIFMCELLWFACLNEVMSEEAYTYLFGWLTPSAAMVMTMIFRFIPLYIEHMHDVQMARKGIGLSGTKRKEKFQESLAALSVLTSWALEHGLAISGAMEARGYGCGRRTWYSQYVFTRRDVLLLVLIGIFLGGTVWCLGHGGAAFVYLPSLQGARSRMTAAGLCFFGVFLSIPSICQWKAKRIWHR